MKNSGFTLLEALIALALVSFLILAVLNGLNSILEMYSDLDRKKASVISFLFEQTSCETTFEKAGGACASPKKIDLYSKDERKLENVIEGLTVRAQCDNTDIHLTYLDTEKNDYKTLTEIPMVCGQACYNQQTITQTINFPPITPMCNWSWSFPADRPAHQAKFWGHKTQKVLLSIPAGSRVCSMSMNSVTNNIRFDDYVMISFSDNLIASTALTEAILTNNYGLAKKNGLIQVDQSSILSMYGKGPYGGGFLSETATYCHEDTSKCSFPRTQTTGPVAIEVEDSFFARFADTPPAQPSIEFTVTGDNDATDCSHTGFVLDLTINYTMGP